MVGRYIIIMYFGIIYINDIKIVQHYILYCAVVETITFLLFCCRAVISHESLFNVGINYSLPR